MRNAPGERLKVVLAESGRSVGGTERVVWELATRLSPQRFDVRVWLSPVKELDEFAAALEARGLGVERLAEVDSRWDWRGMLDTWLRLRRARPDVLHVHHVWPAADRYLCMLARAAGVRRRRDRAHHRASRTRHNARSSATNCADAATAVRRGAVAERLGARLR